MVSPTKSPNMMSTTGRMPVMAAPTAIPVKPASEMGVSSTRSRPNSSTRPERTLRAVPASATSSPMMKTRLSRRISSARASRTASPSVISRVAVIVSGIYVLVHLVHRRVGRRQRELHGVVHLGLHFGVNGIEAGLIGQLLAGQILREKLERIALALPLLLFLLGAIGFSAPIPPVMPGD